MSQIWEVLNSPVGVAAVAAVFLFLLNKLYAKNPTWKSYEGTILAAIKFAEKKIPDDSVNGAINKLDEALKYVVRVHEETTRKTASRKVIADLKEGIQIKHGELEDSGKI